MFFPAANQIGFATNGSETVRINANGAMALGTNTIADKLHVFNDANGGNLATAIRLGQGYNSAHTKISSNFGGSVSFDAGIGAGQPEIYFKTNNIIRQKLVSNGDVYFYEDTGTTPKFVWDSSTERLGIGTSSPSHLLHLSSDTPVPLKLDRTTNADSYISYKNTTDEWTAGLDTSEGFVIANGAFMANPRLTIDSSGNVGIGTSSPSQKLDVVGSIEVSDGIYIGGTGSANKLDDYEEGTWTPEYEPATGDPFTSISYGFRYATYTKIGRQVTCLLSMRTSALTKGTASGAIVLSGLPFTVGNNTNLRAFTPVGIGTAWLVNNPSNIRSNENDTTANIQKNFENLSLQVSDMDTGGADNFMALEFTYFTD